MHRGAPRWILRSLRVRRPSPSRRGRRQWCRSRRRRVRSRRRGLTRGCRRAARGCGRVECQRQARPAGRPPDQIRRAATCARPKRFGWWTLVRELAASQHGRHIDHHRTSRDRDQEGVGMRKGLRHCVRGAYMMTATPTRHTSAPMTSQRSGLNPSRAMPQANDPATKTPP